MKSHKVNFRLEKICKKIARTESPRKFSGREPSLEKKSRQRILKGRILFRKSHENNFHRGTLEQSFPSRKLKTIEFWLGHHGQEL
jgi:hypothetical protein